jgi:hypothetical protein
VDAGGSSPAVAASAPALHAIEVGADGQQNLADVEQWKRSAARANGSLWEEGALFWSVAEDKGDGCFQNKSDGCMQSKHWPRGYENYEHCTIQIDRPGGRLSLVEPFDIESSFDFLIVNNLHVKSDGRELLDVQPAGTIQWTADDSIDAHGWKLCLKAPRLNVLDKAPMPVQAPASLPVDLLAHSFHAALGGGSAGGGKILANMSVAVDGGEAAARSREQQGGEAASASARRQMQIPAGPSLGISEPMAAASSPQPLWASQRPISVARASSGKTEEQREQGWPYPDTAWGNKMSPKPDPPPGYNASEEANKAWGNLDGDTILQAPAGPIGDSATGAAAVRRRRAPQRNFGHSDCRCIGIAGITGGSSLAQMGDNSSYPTEAGSHCGAWDDGRFPGFCEDKTQTPGQGQGWCQQQWCYVDPCSCDLDVLPKKSDAMSLARFKGRPLYFSYATCTTASLRHSVLEPTSICPSLKQRDDCKSAPGDCTWSESLSKCGGKENMQECDMDGQSWYQAFGRPECPCIGQTGRSGEIQVTLGDLLASYPADTGGMCASWDDGRYPGKCQFPRDGSAGMAGQSPGSGDGWCASRWCFVDPCNCKLPNRPELAAHLQDGMYQGRPVYVSYATCSDGAWKSANKDSSLCMTFDEDVCTAKTPTCTWTGKECMAADLAEMCSTEEDKGKEIDVSFSIMGFDLAKMSPQVEGSLKEDVAKRMAAKLAIDPMTILVTTRRIGSTDTKDEVSPGAPAPAEVPPPSLLDASSATNGSGKNRHVSRNKDQSGISFDVSCPVPKGEQADINMARLSSGGGEMDVVNEIVNDCASSPSIAAAIEGDLKATAPETKVKTVTAPTTPTSGKLVDVVQRVTGSTPTAEIRIGSPTKLVNVIFDTGSDKLVIKSWLTAKKWSRARTLASMALCAARASFTTIIDRIRTLA